MNVPTTIEIREGRHVLDLVDAFYEKNGSNGRARLDDVFFCAMLAETLIGCVRFCVEDGTPMLRTMRVDNNHQRQGIGLQLLQHFAAYLDARNIRNVYCLPYPHLENFYGRIGFVRVRPADAPTFLQDRLHDYDPSGLHYLCMKRP